MADIDLALPKLLEMEGGYAFVAGDRGGETYCGISRVHHPDWAGWPTVDAWKMAGRAAGEPERNPLLKKYVRAFYGSRFWGPLRLDEIERQEIAEELFDSAVNCGPSRAVKWLQMALNMVGGHGAAGGLAVDGVIGPKTLAAVGACRYPASLLKALNGLQFMHYHDLIQADPVQARFFRGWLRRVWP